MLRNNADARRCSYFELPACGLKCQLKRKKNWHSMFVKIFQVSADKEIGKKSKLVDEFFNSKPFSNSCLRD